MDAGERTRDIYERLPYPPPLPVPLPAPGDLDGLAEVGLRLTPLSRAVTRAAFRLSGFDAFFARLPETAEELLRTHDLRGPALFAPTLSATVALADDPRPMTAVDRAATLVLGARSLHDDVRAGRLPVDQHGGQVLEMGQYPNLFSTCLIIDGRKPRIYKSRRTDRIAVAIGRRLYLLETGDLQQLTFAQLSAALGELTSRTQRERAPADELSAGVLTASDHGTQCKVFRRLGKSEVNRSSLLALRDTFLTVCLDLDSHPASDAEAAALAHAGNWGNRWYHAALQLVVFGNGKAAGIFNFAAYVDGNVMMRSTAEIQRRGAAQRVVSAAEPASEPLPPARALAFDIDVADFLEAMQDARRIQDGQRSTCEIQGIGRTFFASHGVQPIPAFVVALQMAIQRFSDDPIQVKQILTMSKHRCTDFRTAVVSTPEVLSFVESIASGPPASAAPLLRAAIASQAEACRQARRAVSLAELVLLFVTSMRGIRRWIAVAVLATAVRLLTLLGLYRPRPNQAVISHPDIHEEAPLIVRAGVRVPYLEAFALHYQVHDEKIVVTITPSVVWLVPNAELFAELRASLDRLRTAIEAR